VSSDYTSAQTSAGESGSSSTPAASFAARKRLLDPSDRISEILFGLIMALTFTGALSVANAGKEEVRTMLVGAIGCNLAWGIVDAVMYLMACLTDRGQSIASLRAVQQASTPEEGRRIIAGTLPPAVVPFMSAPDLEFLWLKLKQLPAPQKVATLTQGDFLGAGAVFLLVFLSTFPVVVPFLFMSHAAQALRLSNGIAIVMLFWGGVAYGRYAGVPKWLMGLIMVVVGLLLVGITIALGG
jgi:hypothetical protein